MAFPEGAGAFRPLKIGQNRVAFRPGSLRIQTITTVVLAPLEEAVPRSSLLSGAKDPRDERAVRGILIQSVIPPKLSSQNGVKDLRLFLTQLTPLTFMLCSTRSHASISQVAGVGWTQACSEFAELDQAAGIELNLLSQANARAI